MTREDRKKGFFVAFDYSPDALTEIDAFFRKSGKVIVALTVKEILEEHWRRSWRNGDGDKSVIHEGHEGH